MINPNGCWTCKARRKKCDERNESVCDNCKFLQIECHRGAKPEWMDGGSRQDEMAQFFKKEVRAHSHSRLAGRGQQRRTVVGVDGNVAQRPVVSQQERLPEPTKNAPPCAFAPLTASEDALDWESRTPFSETVLLSFYLDTVLPFLLPFYHPDPQREGGRAWILEFASSSHVVRGVILSQSSYFFALSRGTSTSGWNAIEAQSATTFQMLHHATDVMIRTSVREQLQGAVRVLTGIVQMQRFDVCIGSFENCGAHLEVATELFCDILACAKEQLGQPAKTSPTEGDTASCVARLPDAGRAALRTSTALILFDDVMASIVLQRSPRLSKFHEYLLGKAGDTSTGVLKLDEVVGCPNGVLLEMARIADLNSPEPNDQQSSSMNSVQLAERVTVIRDSLHGQLLLLEQDLQQNPPQSFPIFEDPRQAAQRRDVARIWIHTALLQLNVVTVGNKPNDPNVSSHVQTIIDLMGQLSPPSLLRSLAWPLCIAGSLADGPHRCLVRRLMRAVQPPSLYGAVAKAFSIVERVWYERDIQGDKDLFSFLKDEVDLPLMV